MELTEKNILLVWIKWQFWEVPCFILRAWGNFLRFGLEYFSIPLLLKTFFAHWRRYKWEYPRAFDAGSYLKVLFSNMISITIGVICRSVLIIIGVIWEIITFLLGILIFLSWLTLPFIIVWLTYHGLRLLSY